MSKATQVLVKTGVGVMGYSHLDKAYAYKGNDDNKKNADEEKKQSKPIFSGKLIFDKEKDKRTIDAILKKQEAVIEKARRLKQYSKRKGINLAFKDCDEDEITLSDNTVTTIAKDNPDFEGKYRLDAKSPAYRRVPVFYLDEKGVRHKMPEPIIDPDETDEDEMNRASQIEALWNDKVFPGQYAVFVVTFDWYSAQLGQGVSARLDMVIIVGGGTPANMVKFEDVFTEEDMDDLVAWRSRHVDSFDPIGSAADDSEDDEAETKPKRRKTRKSVRTEEPEDDDSVEEEEEEAPKPRRRRSTRKPVRRVKPVEDVDDEEEADEETGEIVAKPKRRKPAAKPRKRVPVEEEPDEEEIEEDEDAYEDDDLLD